jgi:hypothetical protein
MLQFLEADALHASRKTLHGCWFVVGGSRKEILNPFTVHCLLPAPRPSGVHFSLGALFFPLAIWQGLGYNNDVDVQV